MTWPRDTRADLEAFYSRHQLAAHGRPTAAWQRANLTLIPAPYPLTLSWNPSVRVRKVLCHKKVAESLTRILAAILRHYGSPAEVQRARMHLWAGCYNFRITRNGDRLSTHAWGAGVDLDPERNPLGAPYDETRGMMPKPVIQIFAAEGWRWGGTWRTRPDCMHFQATA